MTDVSCWPGGYPGGMYPGVGSNVGVGFPAARLLRWQADPTLGMVPDLIPPTPGGRPETLMGVKADKHY